jgi:hypothetical protein
MIVKENIEFKRGQDSRKSMDVGLGRKLYPPIIWENLDTGTYMVKSLDAYKMVLWEKDQDLFSATIWSLDPIRPLAGNPYETTKESVTDIEWIKRIETPQHLIDQGYPE